MKFLAAQRTLLIIILLIFFRSGNSGLYAQVYKIGKNEGWVLGGTIAFSIGGEVAYRNKKSLTIDDITSLDLSKIPAFDRNATKYYSEKIQSISDVCLVTFTLTPALLLFDEKLKPERKAYAFMYSEAFFLTVAETELIKGLVCRKRPFVYNSTVDNDKKLSADASASFFSGHTSMTSMGAFLIAKIYSDLHPDMNNKALLWTAAALLPATTGYLRIRGGKHFPTDVICGFVIGALNGILIPELHKVKSGRK